MLEHSASKSNEYAYMLDGLNANWQFIGTDRKATFTNLYPGTYTLKVKASNRDGVWTTSEKKLTINIRPGMVADNVIQGGNDYLFYPLGRRHCTATNAIPDPPKT